MGVLVMFSFLTKSRPRATSPHKLEQSFMTVPILGTVMTSVMLRPKLLSDILSRGHLTQTPISHAALLNMPRQGSVVQHT